jgi:hypothetical protein
MMQRKCMLMEILPIYVQLTLDRYEEFTGKDAVRTSDGKTWKAIKQGQ